MTYWVRGVCRWMSESSKHHESSWGGILSSWYRYEVATISRLLVIIGLFCKTALWKRRYSARETYNFKEPTNRSHPIDGSESSKYRKIHDICWGISKSSKNHEVRDATNWVRLYTWFSEFSKQYDATYWVRGACRWIQKSRSSWCDILSSWHGDGPASHSKTQRCIYMFRKVFGWPWYLDGILSSWHVDTSLES